MKLVFEVNHISVSLITAGINAGEIPVHDAKLPDGGDLEGLGFSDEQIKAEASRMFASNKETFVTENEKGKTESIWHHVKTYDDSS